MDKVYVVVECIRDYERYTEFPIFVTHNIDLANTKVDEMNSRLQNRNTVYDAMNKHMAEWEKINPRPHDDSFSAWAMERYDNLEKFKDSLSDNDLNDLEIDSDSVWEIEEVPYAK